MYASNNGTATQGTYCRQYYYHRLDTPHFMIGCTQPMLLANLGLDHALRHRDDDTLLGGNVLVVFDTSVCG